MARLIAGDDEKRAINLLRKAQPRTLDEIVKALGKRGVEVTKIVRSLESKGIILKESLSGEEKYWLTEDGAYGFLGRDPTQRQRLKHSKNRKKKGEGGEPDPHDPAVV